MNLLVATPFTRNKPHGRKGRLQIQKEHERAPALFKRNIVHEIVGTPGQFDYQPVHLFGQHNLTAEP
jgi:hypothetical protein